MRRDKAERQEVSQEWESEQQGRSESPWERAKGGSLVIHSNSLGGGWLTLKNAFVFSDRNATGSAPYC